MSNEAYASQYIDHHVARHARCGPVVMSRQNLAQGTGHPWVAHGCLDGAVAFATDAMQVLGPSYRDAGRIDPEPGLPGERLQHEAACPMIQSRAAVLEPGGQATWTFFGLFEPDHPEASSDADLEKIDRVPAAAGDFMPRPTTGCAPVRGLLQDAAPVTARPFDAAAIAERYPERAHEEKAGDRVVSFFVPDGTHNRHVVLRDKEATLARRHGAILRTGQGMLLDETTMCATCWMHGVFASLLTIGNTSFHRLFSAARDPYNITRSGGLRVLIEAGGGWQLLAEPSVFEMGLSDCRWIYRLEARTVTVRAVASGDDPAMQWRIAVEGVPCRFLVFGGLVLGEREFDHAGRVEIDADNRRIAFRPDPASLWGQRYPDAVYHLVTSTPDAIEAVGGDELLYTDGQTRSGAFVALRTRPTDALDFAVVGALADPDEAERLAAKYARGVDDAASLAPAARYWQHVTRNLRLSGDGEGVAALNTILPWLAQNAMVHLTVPHGLEQSGGAAWGTRDVCQGPVELLLALEHDATVKEILRIVFAQQQETRGDWPQWFMLEPYAQIRDRHSHGDVIVWPLKALCDYVEATDDLAFLDEPVAWRREDDFAATAHRGSGGGACGEAACHRARAVHPRHAPDPLRRGGLEQLAAAGRPEDARLDGEQLDGRPAVPAAEPLRRGAGPGRPRRRGGGAGRARGRHARGLQSPSGARWHRRRLRPVRCRPGGAGAAAAPERHPNRPPLFAAADDPQHHRRAVHRGAGAASSAAHSRPSAVP